jgi:GNAT superfamily N-acetyltransferase
MEPSFRIATGSDIDLLLPMMREYYAFDHHPFDPEKARAALTGLPRDPALGRVWLICDGDSVVGYIVLTFSYSLELLGRDSFVDEFFLRENYRGQGWGRKTMEFVEEAARGLEVHAIHLEVTRHHAGAQQFYRKLGFEDRGHHLMSKWIDRSLQKPGHGPETPRSIRPAR